MPSILSSIWRSSRFPQIGYVNGKGLVAGIGCMAPGSRMQPDGALAYEVVDRCLRKGVLMFRPVGPCGATIKISPPLVIHEAAILDSVSVLEEAFAETLKFRTRPYRTLESLDG